MDVVYGDGAVVVNSENAVDEFNGDAVVIGGFGQFVTQVERTAQRGFGVVQIGRDAEREIQRGFGQVGHKGFGVDALPDDVYFADEVVNAFGKRAQLGVGVQADAVAC